MTKTQILIVEDEGLVAKDVQAMLRRLGYHVPVTAGTGEQAIEAARQNQPNLVLMDIQLRGKMDGVEAAAIITSEQDIPMLYLTANSDEATFLRAKGTDPFGFLVKPYEERSLQAGIEMALYKHQSEKVTKEREQWLATTLGSIADAVIATDASGRVTFVNPAAEQLSGWSREASLGLAYHDVFAVENFGGADAFDDLVAKALNSGSAIASRQQAILRRKDGVKTEIEHSVAPLRHGPKEQVSGCVIVFSDVSDRMELEEKLRQAQKLDAIGKLAGGIAHDFNNAITAIIGYAEMILRDAGSVGPLHKHAKQIVRAAEHSARLTHQLLAFSRKQLLQPRCLDLSREVSEIEGMVRRLIGENIRLELHSQNGLWNALADPGQIHQVVLNMAINARDAMPAGGTLTIRLENASLSAEEAARIPEGRPGEFARLSIADTGIGMTPEILKRIFEPFFTTKEPGKGTGLGLATCYGIVRQTRGLIGVESTPGAGSTFSIYLPRADAPVAAAEAPVDATPAGSGTILLVEDEEILRSLGVQILESFGYSVASAADGREAMEKIENWEGPLDLVITDLVMPRVGGRELVEWLSSNRPEVRVLLMSGYTDDEIIRTAIEGSQVPYLQKPFTPTVLARKVHEILESAACAA